MDFLYVKKDPMEHQFFKETDAPTAAVEAVVLFGRGGRLFHVTEIQLPEKEVQGEVEGRFSRPPVGSQVVDGEPVFRQ